MNNITILTEAGYEKGFGHFQRMSSICDRAKKDNIHVEMIIEGDCTAKKAIVKDYVKFLDWQKNDCDFEGISKESLVVVDSYNVKMNQLERIKKVCQYMIVIDDNCRLDYNNMNILNPNYYADFIKYPEGKGNNYFLGKDYLLLRDCFRLTEKRTVREKVESILITMGGTDPKHETIKCIKAIKETSLKAKLNVVVTSAYSDACEISFLLEEGDSLYKDIDAMQMSSLMKEVDFAIATAGGTSNELVKMQCPALLIVVADNQIQNADILSQKKCVNLPQGNMIEEIKKMFLKNVRTHLVDNMNKFASEKTGVDFIIELAKGEKDVKTINCS